MNINPFIFKGHFASLSRGSINYYFEFNYSFFTYSIINSSLIQLFILHLLNDSFFTVYSIIHSSPIQLFILHLFQKLSFSKKKYLMIAQVFFLGPEKIFFSATAFLKNHVRKQLGSQPHNPQTKRTPAATNKLRSANRFKQIKLL